MPKSVLGAQMYTIRDFCKTPVDLGKSCARLRKMGYEVVQVSGIGAIDVKELARILEGEGLYCCVTHKSLDEMKNVSQIVDYHAALKCKYTAIGGFGFGGKPLAEWQAFVKTYSDLSKQLAAKGLRIGYHNHSHEFARVEGRRIMDLLVEELDPSVWIEFDTYWVTHGGGDPAAWIDRVQGRIPCVHLKDLAITADRQQKMCEIGAGNLNWPRILESCKKAGVEWYLIERDAGDLDPFESLKISLENLRGMGLH
jgi:sugar phosphate isomerase/epimerase